MKIGLLLSICFLVAVVQAHAQVTPPMGSEILLDGKCSADEWLDAKTMASNEGHSIRMKRSERYLYLCITYPEDAGGTFEGYLVTDAQRPPLNIHVSAKIGEREWQGEDWPEWDWWNAQGWWSTPVRYNSFEAGERRFLRTPAREIQYDLNHFGRSGWRLMFDVYYGRNDDGTYRTLPLPAGAKFADQSTWFEFRL